MSATKTARLFSFRRLVPFTLSLLVAIGIVGANPSIAHEMKAGDLVIEHPWSRATPAGANVASGYLVIRNEGSDPDKLLAVSSGISAKGEIHEMTMENGVMKMRPVADGVEIPAGESVEFKPGAYHFMFMGLSAQPKEGESFSGVLTFEKAGDVPVEFSVGAMGGQEMHSGHGD